MSESEPSSPVDGAYAEFEKHMVEFKEYENRDLTESDTRCKVIDKILALLGWTEQAISRECFVRANGEYLDYKLTTTFPTFVIEAKKNFQIFEIPPGNRRYFRVGGAIKKTKILSEAIEQSRTYAINSGILYCCITNGFQFVFFRSVNNYGVPWDRQLVTVFRSHQDILSRFSAFYECISHETVSSGRFSESIPVIELPGHYTSRFQALSEIVNSGHQMRDRNVLYPYTRELIKRVFQSLDNEEASPDLLTNCYVESSRDSSYERGIGELLRDHRTKIPEPVLKLQTQKKHAGAFQDHFEHLAESRPAFGSVTLILGTVGAGKTTFLNRFRKVFARDLIESSFVWVQISFNEFVESQDSLSPWVGEQIRQSLESNYGDLRPLAWESLEKVYDKEISALRDGLLKPLYVHDTKCYELRIAEEVGKLAENRETHYFRCLAYFSKQQHRQIILIFDNADQHSPRLQNDVFLLAQKHAQTLKCVAFISLREESYWKNKEFGGLSAFHPTSFQIRAPRLDQVLAKRFKYASKLILEDKALVAGHFASAALDLSPEQVDLIFRALHKTLLGEDRRFIRFLEYMAPGEVRRSLDFVARFLTSGHTNINRLLDFVAEGRSISLGFHEFLQAVMLGDRMRYSERFSDVINLFAPDGKGDQSHFNRLSVLARVLRSAGETSEHGSGYVRVEDVCHDCESVGLTNETTLNVIGLLTEKRLLATETLARDWLLPSSFIKATSAALYYVTELGPTFTYLDQILADTEIGNEAARLDMNHLTQQINVEQDRTRRISLRVQRGKIFINYLASEYESCPLSKSPLLFESSATSLVARVVRTYDEQGQSILQSAYGIFDPSSRASMQGDSHQRQSVA